MLLVTVQILTSSSTAIASYTGKESSEPGIHFDGGRFEFQTYDVFNRLIDFQNERHVATYTYKPDGLLLSKTVDDETTVHVWAGTNIVADVDAEGNLIGNYFRGIGLIKNQDDEYFVFNARGDVVQLVDGSGTITQSYIFDAFGNEADPDEYDTNPWRYTGEYFDFESGRIYLRARFYNPRTGRFITEDPYWNIHNMIFGDENTRLGDALGLNIYTFRPCINAIRQSSNLFVYAGNNPVRFVDPSGEFKIAAIVGLGVTVFNKLKSSPNPAPANNRQSSSASAKSAATAATVRPPTTTTQAHHVSANMQKTDGFAGGNTQGRASQNTGIATGSTPPLRMDLRSFGSSDGTSGARVSAFNNTQEATAAARNLGFSKTNFHSHGQPVFKKGNRYITPDVDSHSGGTWKMADSVRNLNSKNTRLGTFDENLNWIGR